MTTPVTMSAGAVPASGPALSATASEPSDDRFSTLLTRAADPTGVPAVQEVLRVTAQEKDPTAADGPGATSDPTEPPDPDTTAAGPTGSAWAALIALPPALVTPTLTPKPTTTTTTTTITGTTAAGTAAARATATPTPTASAATAAPGPPSSTPTVTDPAVVAPRERSHAAVGIATADGKRLHRSEPRPTEPGITPPEHSPLPRGTGAARGAPGVEAPGKSADAPGQLKKVDGQHSARDLAPGRTKDRPEAATPATHAHHPLTAAPDAAPPVVPPAPVAAPTHALPDAVTPTAPTHTVRPAIAAAASRLSSENGRTSLIVRLDPPELGAVLVRMTVRDGQVDVTLRAPDLAAQGSLLSQQPEIQQVLREAGLDLSSFEVSYGDLAQQADKDHPQESRQTPDRGTPRHAGRADGTSRVTDDVTDPQPAGTWL